MDERAVFTHALEHLADTHDAEVFQLRELVKDLRRRNGDLQALAATQAAEIAQLKAPQQKEN